MLHKSNPHPVRVQESEKFTAEVFAKAVGVLGEITGHVTASEKVDIRDNGSVGIYHETIMLSDANVETVYGNMPTFGLAAVTGVVAASKRGQTARQRMVGADQDGPAVEPY